MILIFNLINMFAIIALTFFSFQTQHSLPDVFSVRFMSVIVSWIVKNRNRDRHLGISQVLPVERAVWLQIKSSQYSRSPVSGAILNRHSDGTPVHSIRFTQRSTKPSEFSYVIYVSCLPSCFERCNSALTWWKPFL